MRKFFTYLMLGIYLLSFPEARQLLKLPNLIEHYISHQLRDENNSIVNFIKIHYLDEQIMDDDYSQDMKLPFKKHDISISFVTITVPPKAVEYSFTAALVFVEKQQNFAYKETFSRQYFKKSGSRLRFNFY